MMPPKTPKVNFLVKSKSEAKPISRTLKYLFTLFHVVLALDFGFIQFKSSRMKKVFKFVTFSQSSILALVLCYGFMSSSPDAISAWYFLDAFLFYIYTIVALKTKDSYYDFQLDLHSFDTEIEADSDSYNAHFALLIWFLAVLTFRICVTLTYCYATDVRYCQFPLLVQWGYNLAMLGLNVVMAIYAFVFHSVYYRIKKFTSYVEKENIDVVSCNYLYKNIAEITERMKKTFDIVVSIHFGYFNNFGIHIAKYLNIFFFFSSSCLYCMTL